MGTTNVSGDRKVADAIATVMAWIEERFDHIERRLDALPGVVKPPTGIDDQGMTLKDFANKLSVSEHTIARAISHGKVKAVYIGARLTIPASELARVLREGIPDIPAGYKAKGTGQGAGAKQVPRKRKA
jgi:hypothetical protein